MHVNTFANEHLRPGPDGSKFLLSSTSVRLAQHSLNASLWLSHSTGLRYHRSMISQFSARVALTMKALKCKTLGALISYITAS